MRVPLATRTPNSKRDSNLPLDSICIYDPAANSERGTDLTLTQSGEADITEWDPIKAMHPQKPWKIPLTLAYGNSNPAWFGTPT